MTTCILKTPLTEVESALREAIDLTGYRSQAQAFFIKPNLSDAGPAGQGLFSDPAVVEALVRILDSQQIVIG